MSTNSQDSVAPASIPPIVQRLSAIATRAFHCIDLPSLQLALKSCLAIAVATGLAFWLDLSPTITAITAFMIQQGYVGSTIYRGALRFLGGTAGALIALVVLALFSQDRTLFIISIALLAGVIVYLLQATRYWYAYIICLASLIVGGYGSIEHPQNSFAFVVNWVSGILLAVVVVAVVRSLLWPHLTSDVFEQQLRGNFENCRKLLRTTMDSLVDGKDNAAELDRLEQSLIQGMAQPQTTLQTAFLDSWQVDRFDASYNLFLNQLNSLAHVLIEVREHLRICQTRSALTDLVQRSDAVRQIASALDDHMQSVIAALAEPRDGTSGRLNLAEDRQHDLDALFNRMAEEVQGSEADLLDKAALLGLHTKLAALGKQIPELHKTLANVETAAAQTAARADAKTHQAAPPFKPRMIKAVTASILMIVVPAIWILTNWPMALNRLMIYTAVLACFNALFPSMPRRAILTALFWGVLGGAIMYFVVMRPLEGFLELALALSLALLPCCYFVNSPNPLTMISGLFTGMIIIGLMDLSLEQSYSFSSFANNVIGYSGGFMIALIILQLFTNSTPEQTFRKNVLAFFHACGQTIDALSADPPWTEKGSSCLASGQSGILKSFKMSGLWSRMVNPRRATEHDAGKVSRVLGDMQSLLFRIEMLENARFQAPDDPALATLAAGERELRESLTKSLGAIQSTILSNVVVSEPLNDDATAAQTFRRQVASLRDQFSKDSIGHANASRVLVLMGYYQALADAIDKCHEDVKALNWQRWERSYI